MWGHQNGSCQSALNIPRILSAGMHSHQLPWVQSAPLCQLTGQWAAALQLSLASCMRGQLTCPLLLLSSPAAACGAALASSSNHACSHKAPAQLETHLRRPMLASDHAIVTSQTWMQSADTLKRAGPLATSSMSSTRPINPPCRLLSAQTRFAVSIHSVICRALGHGTLKAAI